MARLSGRGGECAVTQADGSDRDHSQRCSGQATSHVSDECAF
jgi:hypothetical protein